VLYDNVDEVRPLLPEFDDVFFASASGVESFLRQYGEKKLRGKGIYVMGKPTLSALPEAFAKKAKITAP
jgi:uroporphyrinogen-III synthase